MFQNQSNKYHYMDTIIKETVSLFNTATRKKIEIMPLTFNHINFSTKLMQEIQISKIIYYDHLLKPF